MGKLAYWSVLLACSCSDVQTWPSPDLGARNGGDPGGGGGGGSGDCVGLRVAGGEGVLAGPCPPGAQPRSCYSGPPETEDIGACHSGVQRCLPPRPVYVYDLSMENPYPGFPDLGEYPPRFLDFSVPSDLTSPGDPLDMATIRDLAPPEPGMPRDLGLPTTDADGWRWGPCEGERVPRGEGSYSTGDDNCDGVANSVIRCTDGGVPYPTVTRQPPACNSAVVPGGQWSLLASAHSCLAHAECGAGQTTVLLDGKTYCSDASPPDCGAEEALDFSIETKKWGCVPCTHLILFGQLYDGARHCVGPAVPMCPPDQVPTFDAATLMWICKPPCDNGFYDVHTIDGTIICVPC